MNGAACYIHTYPAARFLACCLPVVPAARPPGHLPPPGRLNKQTTRAQIEALRANPDVEIDANTDALFRRVVHSHQHNVVVGLQQGLGVAADSLLPGVNLRAALTSVAESADDIYRVCVCV